VLHGDACPVVEDILAPRIAGESSCDDAALTGAPGDRGSATKRPQGVAESKDLFELANMLRICPPLGCREPEISSDWVLSPDPAPF
jgi:hypothetical protein